MAGKQGQRTTKKTGVPTKYTENFLADLDGRYTVARALKGRYLTLVADLGGFDALSYQQQSLCKRVIYLEAHIGTLEAELASNKTVNINAYTQMVNTLIGLLRAVGLERKTKDVSLGEYLKTRDTDKDEHSRRNT